MTQDELTRVLTALPGVAVVTASEANGAPEVAWGDSFFSYDPDGTIPDDRRFPFATIVVNDYPGFDESSRLGRPEVYRLNLAVGRERFEELFAFPPAEFENRRGQFDFAALDEVFPHPVYGTQGWASVVVPGARTAELTRALITHAYGRAKDRHRPPR
jgi:hypothetical protein